MRYILVIFFFFNLSLIAQDIVVKSDNYFADLSNKERAIIVDKGTERAWSGAYNNHYENGLYVCKACNNPLFTSEAKFKSNCGWPSFDDEIKDAIVRITDYSLNMTRVEICCANCKGHLGHVFEGEKLTDKDLRHCVNSISIKFSPIITDY